MTRRFLPGSVCQQNHPAGRLRFHPVFF